MNKNIILIFSMLITAAGFAQKLPVAWEELTAPRFVEAVGLSEGVCIIPIGVIEKHGTHLPLGTDVYTARYVAAKAAEKEYCLVFPYFYSGQIFEAMHVPGTIAYSPSMLFNLLDETCREIARNGVKKIILYNTHGGNNYFLQYFCQAHLSSKRDYVVYYTAMTTDAETQKLIDARRISKIGGHADELETANMLVIRPDLVDMAAVKAESGANKNDALPLGNLLAGIWWYGRYPNHYAGEASGASASLGQIMLAQKVDLLATIIKRVKQDKVSIPLQDQFFKEALVPLETKAK